MNGGGNPSVGGGGFAASPAGTAPLYYKSAEIASGSAKNLCKKSEDVGGVCPARHRLDLPLWCLQGACLFCRPPTVPFACFPAPYPPPPFPGGEGGAPKFISPGSSPPAPLHLTACGTHRACQAGTRRGACPVGRPLPLPLSSFLPPIPPPPFPGGEGGDFRLFHARGFAPCIPAPEPEAALARRALAVPAGAHRGLVAGSPCRPCPRRGACLLCRPLPLPLPFFCPLSPHPPSPVGKGVPQSLFRRGLRPRHPCI